jgi:hypothetical protein
VRSWSLSADYAVPINDEVRKLSTEALTDVAVPTDRLVCSVHFSQPLRTNLLPIHRDTLRAQERGLVIKPVDLAE